MTAPRSGAGKASDRKMLLGMFAAAEAQGWTLHQKSRGIMLRSPEGKAVMAHLSVSDNRGMKNLRSELRRAGLILRKGRQ
jgi:hypothetical protein